MDANLRAKITLSVAWTISKDVITLTVEGPADDDLPTAIIAAMSSPDFPPNPAVLLDTRRSTENPNPDQLRLRAGWIASMLSRRHQSRCALVVGARPHHYGLARMLLVFLGTEGIHGEIFTTTSEALRWLTPAGGGKVGGATT